MFEYFIDFPTNTKNILLKEYLKLFNSFGSSLVEEYLTN